MAQHDYSIANQSGSAFRSDLNNALSAIATQNSGTSAPSTTFAHQMWADTTNNVMKLRNAANDGWIELYQLDGEWTDIAFENGTAAAPSIYFKDSGTDTGFYSPGANQVGITTGGTSALVVDASQRVGVGTTSPDTLLHVKSSAVNPRITLESTSSQGGQLLFKNTSASTGFVTGILGTTAGDGAIWHQDNKNVIFATNNTERLRIDSSGRVGIGTSSPGQVLDVQANDARFNLTSTGSGQTVGISIKGGGGGGDTYNYIESLDSAGTQKWYIGSNGTANTLAFKTNGNNERMRIDSSGRVGIGTTSASARLHVFGTGSSSNTLPANASAVFETDGNAVLAVSVPSASAGGVVFPRGTDAYYAGIERAGTDLNLRNNGSTRATIDSSGRLLVGTSSTVSIAGSSAFIQQHGNKSTANIGIAGYANNLGGPILAFGASRSTTVGTPGTIVSSGDILGDIRFAGDDGTDINTSGASIRGEVDGTPGANDMPGRLVFSTTADGASSPTERMRITNNGTVVFPASSGSHTFANSDLGIASDSSYGQFIRFGNTYGGGKSYCTFTTNGTTVGTISANGTTGTTYSTTSDYRLKENVVAVTDGISRLQRLKPNRFNFIADPDTTVDGFIAHEVQDIVPEAVTGEKDAVDDEGNPVYQGIDQSKLVPLLTAALQEAIAKIETLEQRLNDAGIS